MMRPHFIHLHIHSDYSMIDGISKINEIVDKSISLNMPALAITDFCNLFGLIKFYDYSCRMGLKAIFGADFLIQNEFCIHDIDLNMLTCLVVNEKGYRNLIKIISTAYKHKNSTIPIIQRSWLMEFNEGLIVLSGGRDGDLGKCLLNNKKKELEQHLFFYNKYFQDRYYIEIVRTGRDREEFYLQLAIELAKIKGLPLVATNDVRFIHKDMFQAHEIRVAIQNGIIIGDSENHATKYSSEQFLKSEEQMCTLFSDVPESLVNSVEIAYRCNFIVNLNGNFLPKFPTGSLSAKDFLIAQAKKGLEERLIFLFPNAEERPLKREPYDVRLDNELQVINQMGLPGYFLIVMEFIQWAKNNNIPVGPGRGSGASSLVAYVLKITELDPLKFNLLFERFLNPERISMPDLDIDFCMEQRDSVIDHVIEIYGSDAVSQIITFGTMAAKAVIRDVGRVLGHSYTFVNSIAKLIPTEPGMTLKKAFSVIPQLKLMYKSNEEIRNLVDMARKLEGIIRNVSKHAGGVVISPSKIIDFSPLYYDDRDSHAMTQFDKDDIERIGLIKFDFLGLRTLTIIDRAVKVINDKKLNNGLNMININSIPLDDQKSFRALQTSETTAIFQLESSGIKKLIKRLKPDCFEDLIALIALFRPGPLQSGMVDNFINRKHGLETIFYPDSQWEHKSLRPVLQSTYGIILYQEQVMQIAQVLAGYSLGSADILRRAIGKKKPEDMEKQRSIFNSGAERNGIDRLLSTKIFNLVEKFAGYGFNKSHSAAYALISYQTLWLKTNYSAEFMSAALSSDMDNLHKVIRLIDECRRMNLVVKPPDINNSKYEFCVNTKNEIIYGIGAIKGIGKASIDLIVSSRDKNGNFKDLFDFCTRFKHAKINYRIVEKLILSGAFDSFKINRAKLIGSLNDTIKYANQYIKNKCNKQIDIFDKNISNPSLNVVSTISWDKQFLLMKEKEVLGLYLTDHPVSQYISEVKRYFSNLTVIKEIFLKKNNSITHIFGMLISVRTKLTKQGNHILFGILEDQSSRIEIIIFSKLLSKYQHYLKENNFIFIIGIVNINKIDGKHRVIVQKLQDINSIRRKYMYALSIILINKKINSDLLHSLHCVLKKNQFGTLPVYFMYQRDGIQIKLRCGKKWNITLTDQLLNDLRNLVGYEQIKLEFY